MDESRYKNMIIHDHTFFPAISCAAGFEWIIKLCVYSTTVYFGYLEVLQIMDKKLKYFFDVTNWIDIGSTILNLVLIIKHDFFNQMGYDF